jgi:hypothetical protein
MAQASERPRRKRLSWESRCEIVWLIEQGMSPPLAASGQAAVATAWEWVGGGCRLASHPGNVNAVRTASTRRA